MYARCFAGGQYCFQLFFLAQYRSTNLISSQEIFNPRISFSSFIDARLSLTVDYLNYLSCVSIYLYSEASYIALFMISMFASCFLFNFLKTANKLFLESESQTSFVINQSNKISGSGYSMQILLKCIRRDCGSNFTRLGNIIALFQISELS